MMVFIFHLSFLRLPLDILGPEKKVKYEVIVYLLCFYETLINIDVIQ